MQKLHFLYAVESTNLIQVSVPSRRGDILRDVDLIEEVARLYGYDLIPTSLMNGVTTPGSLNEGQTARRLLRQMLTQSGLHEVINYTFTHPDQIHRFPGKYATAKAITLALPMSEERSTLRTSLIPHLLDVAVYNRNHGTNDINIFEIGRIFYTTERELTKLPHERLLLSILMTGNRQEAHWTGKSAKVDFYDLKGIVQKVGAFFGLDSLEFKAAQPEGFHPGKTAEIVLKTANEIVFGTMGQLHPDLQRACDLDETYLLEIDLDTLTQNIHSTIHFASLPRFPAISRDLAVVVDQRVAAGELQAKISEVAGALLESVEVFDIYTGDRLGTNRKSVALSLIYRLADRTLTDDEVAAVHAKVVTTLEQSFAAELRK